MRAHQPLSAIKTDSSAEEDPPALVVVVNRIADLQRAMDPGWYRIPLHHAPNRVAAEYLAFYQTGAFPPGERYVVRWIAPVRGYFLATRRELIPEEPEHARANEAYYKVLLGHSIALPYPIPSRRLRRITFIPTTLSRLRNAQEINDLWIRSTPRERLWEALKQAGLDAECQYPLQDDSPNYVADFALFCRTGRIAVIVAQSPGNTDHVGESLETVADFLAHAGHWSVFRTGPLEPEGQPVRFVERLTELVNGLGGLADPPSDESLCA
jgi:hypothetical protein